MPLTPYAQKAVLDWVLGGASPTQPSQRWVSFATASPRSDSAFDGPFNSRVTARFGAAASPQTSASNNTTVGPVSGTATALCTVVGWNLWDSTAGGTRLAYGTFAASLGLASADQAMFSVGSFRIVLS